MLLILLEIEMFFTIKLYLYLNCELILNRIVWNRTICIKIDFALNNLQRLICHKTQTTNQTKPNVGAYDKIDICYQADRGDERWARRAY